MSNIYETLMNNASEALEAPFAEDSTGYTRYVKSWELKAHRATPEHIIDQVATYWQRQIQNFNYKGCMIRHEDFIVIERGTTNRVITTMYVKE